jgi:hypothetical protein
METVVGVAVIGAGEAGLAQPTLKAAVSIRIRIVRTVFWRWIFIILL